MESKFVYSQGTYNATFTGNASGPWIAELLAFFPFVANANGSNGTNTGCGPYTVNATISPPLAGCNYLWNGGSSPNSAINTFTDPGLYTVTITSPGGGTITASASVLQGPSITSSVNTNIVYTGTAQTSNASTTGASNVVDFYDSPTGGTLLVTGTAATTNTPSQTAIGTYTYYAEARNTSGGCVSASRTAVTLTIKPATPIIGTITQPSCPASTGSVALSGLPSTGSWTVTASPGGYTQTGSGTTVTFTGLPGGATYTFTVTQNSTLSSASTGATINYPGTAPVVTAQPSTATQNYCNGATATALSVTVTESTGSISNYKWYSNTTTSTTGATLLVTNTTTALSNTYTPVTTTAGTLYYYVVVTNSGGCTSTSNFSGAIKSNATVTAPVIGTITQPVCGTPTGSVALSGLPASGSWTITGSPSGNLSGTGTTGTISGLAASTTYTFTVTNISIGCSSVASSNAIINAAIALPSAPTIGTITQPTCVAPLGSIVLSGLPGTGTWTVVASPGGATVSNSGTSVTFGNLVGTNTYTFVVTNAAGCTSVASTGTTINDPGTAPVITANPSTTATSYCSGVTATALSVTVSAAPSKYQWYSNTVNSPSGGTLVATNTSTATTNTYTPSTASAGTLFYYVAVTNSGGTCTAYSNVSGAITINALPSAPVVGTITQPTCTTQTGSVALSGLPATGFWSVISSAPKDTLPGYGTTGAIASLTANTTYTFTVTNSLGCTSAASGNAVINAAPTIPTAPVIGTITQPNCATSTGSVALSGLPSSGTWTLIASPGGLTNSTTGTTYTFTGLDGTNTYTFSVTNSVGCTSVASAGATITASASAPAITTQPSGLAQNYCNGSTATTLTVGETTGTYRVTATDQYGCTSSTFRTVSANCPMPTGMASTPLARSCTVRWTAPGCVYDYKVQLSLHNSTTYILRPNATATTYTFTGLTPNTTYDWSVRTDCNGTSTFFSNFCATQTFTTPAVRLEEDYGYAFEDFKVYPNPANERVIVSFNSNRESSYTVKIYDFMSRIVKYETNASLPGNNLKEISLDGIAAGVYILELQMGETTSKVKLVVQ